MQEIELLDEIVRIARNSDGVSPAVNKIRSLFAAEWGGALLIVRPASAALPGAFPPAVRVFLESRDFPVRSVYTVPVHDGTLIACIGSWGVPSGSLRRAVDFAGEQLVDLARRLSLPTLEYSEAA